MVVRSTNDNNNMNNSYDWLQNTDKILIDI
jgi:hypothetical protein